MTPITVSSSSPVSYVAGPPAFPMYPPSPMQLENIERRLSQPRVEHQPTPPHHASPSHHHQNSQSHSQSPAGPSPTSRPSMAIHQGADAVLELLEEERAHLTKLYHESIVQIESSVKNARAQDSLRLQHAERKVKSQEKSIEQLSSKLRDAKARAEEMEREMAGLRREHELLKEELSMVGLVWTPAAEPADDEEDSDAELGTGKLEFNARTKRIVHNFMRGARMQQKALKSSRLSASMPTVDLEDDRLSRSVTPTEFFDVLSGVMERGRKFATELEKQRRRERVKAEVNGNGTVEINNSISRSQSQSSTEGMTPTYISNNATLTSA
ncbi:hypothetical protein CVT26_005477 [Gymnopilus dilepis]|uniref:Uncharacterized protein n=1 Tax=Gymnopilus dilepis TaxID=231916 RepID=A0A409YT68_9AGAR|nr:hypothetical protein CVT26_005477 [Gymnopilus dilepis]